jgi:hypothetical protein
MPEQVGGERNSMRADAGDARVARNDLLVVVRAGQAELDHIAAELNGRPRQTLGWLDTIPSTRRGDALIP